MSRGDAGQEIPRWIADVNGAALVGEGEFHVIYVHVKPGRDSSTATNVARFFLEELRECGLEVLVQRHLHESAIIGILPCVIDGSALPLPAADIVNSPTGGEEEGPLPMVDYYLSLTQIEAVRNACKELNRMCGVAQQR